MQTIVAPTDFSEISVNAVYYAADLAGLIGARLNLMHVFTMPMSFSEVPVSAYGVDQMEADIQEEMDALREKLNTRSGGRLEVKSEIREGEVLSSIIGYCEEINPYAVVMGAESADNLERFLIGRKTLAAINLMRWPVLVVPADAHFASIRKIGLACDYRNVVNTIPLNEIKALVKDTGAELHVLHVSTEKGADFTPETIEESGLAQEILDSLKPKFHFIQGDDTETKISQFAENNQLDLLIVVPRKHDLISRIFHHSHSRKLILQTHVPVMAIHE